MPSELNQMTTMNTDALTRLMETYSEAVWNYAYFLSRSVAVADDVAQETFIRAYKHMNAFRGEASAKTWLLQIARNRWLTYRSTAFFRRVKLQEHTDLEGFSPSAEEAYMSESLTGEVWRIVLQLPGKYREVLMLAAHYGLSMEELAHTLGISPSAAKSRLLRARRKANEIWKKEMDY